MECIYYNISANGAARNQSEDLTFYEKIYNDYHTVHGYIATILCSFGFLANICNIVVLTRSEMFSTINMLLTSIAICDSTLMISYIVYLAHFQLSSFKCLSSKYTFAWAVFTVVHADLSVASRACSLWLSVVMAALRSHILSRHQVLLLQSRYIANHRLGYKLIFTTIGAVLVMTIPVFVNHTIESIPVRKSRNNNSCPKTAWIVVPPSVTLEYDCLVLKLGYWTNGLLLKLIPCVLLSYYLIKLIHFVRMHMQHSQSRFGERETVNSLKPTTFILSTILFVTLLCELPNALASLFSGVRSFAYGVFIYKSLGDIFDLLALVNGITSFILYCSMSQMFRQTFLNVACDVRDYFSVRSTDYYRRWSMGMFGASQSTAEFQQHVENQQNHNPAFNGAVSTVEPEIAQLRDASEFAGNHDDKRRLLGSFDAASMQEIPAKRFGYSPSSSSEKLLNDRAADEKNHKKRNRKKHVKNASLPMFDYANLSMNHTKTADAGGSLRSPDYIDQK